MRLIDDSSECDFLDNVIVILMETIKDLYFSARHDRHPFPGAKKAPPLGWCEGAGLRSVGYKNICGRGFRTSAIQGEAIGSTGSERKTPPKRGKDSSWREIKMKIPPPTPRSRLF